MYDLIIKNGTIIDGTGKEAYKADICVLDDKIVGIGSFQYELAKTEIDATDLIVAPGFIDVLNHSDTYLTLFTMPSQESLVTQGVTTIIGGSCGYSLAPLVSSNAMETVQKWANPDQINVDWLKMSEFLNCLSAKKMSLNFGTLVGFNTLIKGVLKNEHRSPTETEKEIMGNLFKQALDEGAFGLSVGMAYWHLREDPGNTLEYFFKITAEKYAIVSVHLKDEWDKFLDSLIAILYKAKTTNAKTHISHLKVIGKKFWGNFDKAIKELEKNHQEGVKISFDVFPYASSALALYLLLPSWAKDGGNDAVLDRLKDPFDRKQILKDLKTQEIDFDKITIASFSTGPLENAKQNMLFVGKTISEIAKDWQTTGEEAIIDLLSASKLNVIVFANLLDEANVKTAIVHPLSVIASAGAGYNLSKINSISDLPHPKSFGAFPRFLRKYIKENNLLSLEQAIEKITSKPAKLFGIKNRGLIQKGNFADLVIFDPGEITDKATFKNPYQYSAGMKEVLVNGQFALHEGKFVKSFSGKVLKKTV